MRPLELDEREPIVPLVEELDPLAGSGRGPHVLDVLRRRLDVRAGDGGDQAHRERQEESCPAGPRRLQHPEEDR